MLHAFLFALTPEVVLLEAVVPLREDCQACFKANAERLQELQKALALSRSWPLECAYEDAVRHFALWQRYTALDRMLGDAGLRNRPKP